MYFRPISPDHFVMILHESPGSRYSLVPGDYLSKGTLKETIRLGELKLLGISKQKKELFVQRENGACRDYDPDDSPAKCYIEKILRSRFEDEMEHIFRCATIGK